MFKCKQHFFDVKSQFNYITDFKAGSTLAMPATLVIKLLSVRVIALIYSSILAAASPISRSLTEILFKRKYFKNGQVRYKPAHTGADTITLT